MHYDQCISQGIYPHSHLVIQTSPTPPQIPLGSCHLPTYAEMSNCCFMQINFEADEASWELVCIILSTLLATQATGLCFH